MAMRRSFSMGCPSLPCHGQHGPASPGDQARLDSGIDGGHSVPIIISASYKTDIPAFYGDWFMNRLEAGFCRMVNPYGGQITTVPLTPGAVDGFVFWTKNLAPFMGHLAPIRGKGFPFTVQYSINNAPRQLERSVTDANRAVTHMHQLSGEAPFCPVWRYDPVVLSTLTPPEWHLKNFEFLAQSLSGATDEVVISFAHIYAKTRRNLDRAAREEGFAWREGGAQEKKDLAVQLAVIAKRFGMKTTLCAQEQFLAPGISAARCIDGERLSRVAGRDIAAEPGGNRPGCLCAKSRDIGDYDTCPHGCVYCYAVTSRERARERFHAHDPQGEFLFPPANRRGKLANQVLGLNQKADGLSAS